jgi:hypothetical protein
MSLTTSPPRQQIVDKINSYLQTNGNITAAQHKEIELLLVDAIYGAQIGDIKEISCNTNYITNNFKTGTGLPDEGLGLLTGERYGWAICNGKNGTVDKRGNVSIGYDSVSYPTLASTQSGGALTPYKQGGVKTVTLTIDQMPPHSHTRPRGNDNNLGGGTNQYGWQAIDDLCRAIQSQARLAGNGWQKSPDFHA